MMYTRNINPNATEKQILNVSHLMVAAFALAMSIFGVIFFYIGVSMGWLYLFMGTLLGSAVVPIALCTTWSKANKWGCVMGAIWGLVAGIIAWIVTTAKRHDKINVETTGGDYEMLAGNLAAIGVGGIISVVSSYLFPEHFDFDITRAINTHVHHHETKATANIKEAGPNSSIEKVPEEKPGEKEDPEAKPGEKEDTHSVAESSVQIGITRAEELDPVALNEAFKFAAWSSVALTVIMVILIPLPLFFASTIYNVAGFGAWVVIAMIWAFVASFTVVLYPLWESREALVRVFKGIVKDIMQPGSGKYVAKHHAAA